MENKSYKLRYLPLFEQDLISTANYITNVLKNEDAAIRLVDDVEAGVKEFREKLTQAGFDKILEECQRQATEFVKSYN